MYCFDIRGTEIEQSRVTTVIVVRLRIHTIGLGSVKPKDKMMYLGSRRISYLNVKSGDATEIALLLVLIPDRPALPLTDKKALRSTSHRINVEYFDISSSNTGTGRHHC